MAEKETGLQKISRLISRQENIRNIATSAHIHHGKTAFTDNLLAAAGLMAAKNAGKDTKKLLKEASLIPEKINSLESNMNSLEEELNSILSKIPNMMHESVALGKNDSENVQMRKIGKPKEFDFEIKNHAEIAESLGVADFDASARTSGNGFYYLQGDLALYPDIETDLLLANVLKKPKEFLFIHPEKTLTAAELKQYNTIARRRRQGEPIAYITGHKS
jgi:seryl-tRNA synthetase